MSGLAILGLVFVGSFGLAEFSDKVDAVLTFCLESVTLGCGPEGLDADIAELAPKIRVFFKTGYGVPVLGDDGSELVYGGMFVVAVRVDLVVNGGGPELGGGVVV